MEHQRISEPDQCVAGGWRAERYLGRPPGTVNQVLKSGTNHLRGAAAWKNQPNNLVANDFFRNRSGLPAQVTHFNQYSIVAGAPVYVPKVVNGRNKVF